MYGQKYCDKKVLYMSLLCNFYLHIIHNNNRDGKWQRQGYVEPSGLSTVKKKLHHA